MSRGTKPWWEYTGHFGSMPRDETLGVSRIYLKSFMEGKTVHHMSTEGEDERGYIKNLKEAQRLFALVESELFGRRMYEKHPLNGPIPTACTVFSWEDGICAFYVAKDKGLSIDLYTLDATLPAKIADLYQQFIFFPEPEAPMGSVWTLVRNKPNAPFEVVEIGFIDKPLERGNYTPEVLEAYDAINRDLRSQVPRGRISIIDGPPGTGKTYIARALITDNPEMIFLLIPPSMLSSLSSPEILPALMKIRTNRVPLVLVLEDADEILTPRMSTNIDSIMATLNMGDGIVGDLLDFRIVATTNASVEEIDPAILRPGRLSRRVQVGKLGMHNAYKVLFRLMAECGKPLAGIDADFAQERIGGGSYTLAEVYSMARDMGWEPPAMVYEDEEVDEEDEEECEAA